MKLLILIITGKRTTTTAPYTVQQPQARGDAGAGSGDDNDEDTPLVWSLVEAAASAHDALTSIVQAGAELVWTE